MGDYQYDPLGNRSQQTVGGVTTTYQYDGADRLLSANNAAGSYSTDANGDLTAAGSSTYLYDQENRLINTGVSGIGSGCCNYRYNGDGEWTGLTIGTQNSPSFLHDATGALGLRPDKRP